MSCAPRTSLLTRPERTGAQETTRLAEADDFLQAAARRSKHLYSAHFGRSAEGRALPLAVWGQVDGPEADSIRASDAVRVLIIANIHAGEVCGKEAALMLVRELARGTHRRWLDDLVIMVAPVYNADGNERFGLSNRPLQNGPVGGMGERPNAQGLDLNRDHMKLESPEARALAALIRDTDPHVFLDLHTTNGTHHAYHLTYAPGLHPATDPGIDSFLRGTWLPEVTASLRDEKGWLTHHYGNVPREGSSFPAGWYTYDHRPRFSTNYVGLRNRFAILSEAYAYSPFDERIASTHDFVVQVLDGAQRHAETIRFLTRQADSAALQGRRLPLAGRHAPSDSPVEILMGEVEETTHPETGERVLQRKDVVRPVSLTEYIRFDGIRPERVPAAYYVPPALTAVRTLLEAHGIRTVPAPEGTAPGERFEITLQTADENPFQGHRQRRLEGAWAPAPLDLPPGTLQVPTAQPLGRLAFALLEPMSDDGAVNWNVLDPHMVDTDVYPIFRTGESPGASATGGGPAAVAASIAPSIRAAVDHPSRPEEDRRRDADRKPGEVLTFFGIEPGMRVGDVMCGTGYYTEIVSRAVGLGGQVYCQNNAFVVARFADAPLRERLADPELGNVVRLDRELEDPGFPDGELDAVILIRFYHDMYWQKTDRKAFNAAVLKALKPGGVFGLVDHHAEPGSRDRDVQTLHRVDAEMVTEEILAAGFELEATSDLLQHPEDTRDWNIFSDSAARRDRTDRFVLRFRKPGGGAARRVR